MQLQATLQLFAIELMLVQALAVGNVQLGKIMQKIECDVTLAAVRCSIEVVQWRSLSADGSV